MTRRAWIAFAIVGLIWGLPYLLIKVAVEEGVAPAFIAWTRVVVATAVMLPIAWWTGALRGLRSRLPALTAFAFVEIVVPFPLIAAGEQYVTSSLAAILIATVPLLVAMLALRFDATERVGGARLIGLLVGLGGVITLLGIDVAGRADEFLGAAMILIAALGYAVGPMIVKRYLADLSPIGPVTGALILSSLLLAPAAVLTAPTAAPSPTAILAIAILGVVCSAVAFVAFFTLIAEAGPSRASVITYVNPAVAVVLGVTLLGERIGVSTLIGLLLILAGSWLSTGGRLSALRSRPVPVDG